MPHKNLQIPDNGTRSNLSIDCRNLRREHEQLIFGIGCEHIHSREKLRVSFTYILRIILGMDAVIQVIAPS